MVKTEIKEIRERKSVKGQNLSDIKFPHAALNYLNCVIETTKKTPITSPIKYSIDGKDGEAYIIIITANDVDLYKAMLLIEDKLYESLDVCTSGRKANMKYHGKQAKDLATVFANNGVKFEGMKLLKKSNVGGERTV